VELSVIPVYGNLAVVGMRFHGVVNFSPSARKSYHSCINIASTVNYTYSNLNIMNYSQNFRHFNLRTLPETWLP